MIVLYQAIFVVVLGIVFTQMAAQLIIVIKDPVISIALLIPLGLAYKDVSVMPSYPLALTHILILVHVLQMLIVLQEQHAMALVV